MNVLQAPEEYLRRLDLKTARRLEGILQGDYRTHLRGVGLDLADLREYQYHDDVRHMDWNVTARLQIPHVRTFLEDRELTAWILLDISSSLDFRSATISKHSLAAEFMALISRFLTSHGNSVGAMLFSDRVDYVVPPRSSRKQTLVLLDSLVRHSDSPRPRRTNLARSLGEAALMIRRRSLIFLVSDFVSSSGWETQLSKLAYRHDVIAVHLIDPMEGRLPDLGLLTFEDAETGEQVFVDTHDPGFRRRYARAAEQSEDDLRASFETAGVDAMQLSTEDDIIDGLLRFADLRKLRLARHS